MARALTDIRSLARQHTTLAVNTLAGVCRKSESDAARVSAAIALLDRGWGRAPTTITGADGGDVRVVVRHILEGSSMPRPVNSVITRDNTVNTVIEHKRDNSVNK